MKTDAESQIKRDLMDSFHKTDLRVNDYHAKDNDPVNHPSHYTSHPSGVECIQVTEHMSFCVGNAVKYLWRADLKHDAVEDLEKARWYIDRELERRQHEGG